MLEPRNSEDRTKTQHTSDGEILRNNQILTASSHLFDAAIMIFSRRLSIYNPLFQPLFCLYMKRITIMSHCWASLRDQRHWSAERAINSARTIPNSWTQQLKNGKINKKIYKKCSYLSLSSEQQLNFDWPHFLCGLWVCCDAWLSLVLQWTYSPWRRIGL